MLSIPKKKDEIVLSFFIFQNHPLVYYVPKVYIYIVGNPCTQCK